MTATGYTIAAINKLWGTVPLDSFQNAAGTLNDDQLMTAAIAAVKADSYPRCIVIANRAHSFANTYPLNWNGARFIGGSTMEREFRETNKLHCPSGGLFSCAGSSYRDFLFSGLAFEGSTGGQWMTSFATDNSAGSWQDVDINNCGFQGFGSVFRGTTLRMDINRIYINGATDTQLVVGGSDNKFFTYGRCFTSGTLAASKPWFDFGVSSSDIDLTYVTPQTGYAARFYYTQGGVVVKGGKSDCTGRSGGLATQQAGILQNIPAGRSITYHDIWVFNAGQNAALNGTSKGLIMVTGGDAVFYSPNFPGSMTGTTPDTSELATPVYIPAIYAGAGSKVRVYSPRAENGGYKHLRQAAGGGIWCDDSSWTIDTAA